jgi:hypothetical protein
VRAMDGGMAGGLGRLRKRLDQSLFPAPRRVRSGLATWEGALLVTGFLVLACVLQLFRIGPSSGVGSLWAEDAPVFLHGGLSEGLLSSVTTPYAGYLVVVQRLIGQVGGHVPLEAIPATMNVLAALVAAACGLAVWLGSGNHLRSPYLRGLLVALTVLCPVASHEAVATATNVSWYMTFAVFWLLLWRPATTWGATLAGLFILASGLSNPGIVFFAPLALLRGIACRDRRDAVIVGSFALALAIQLPVTTLSNENIVDPTFSHEFWATYLQRILDGSLLGEHLGGEAWKAWGWSFLGPLACGVLAFLAVAGLRASSNRVPAAIAVLTSAGMYAGIFYERAMGAAMLWPADYFHGLGGRYAIVPSLLLVSGLLLLVEGRERRAEPRRRPLLAAALAAVLLVGLVTSFDLAEPEVRGEPSWSTSLEAASAECLTKPIPEATVYTSPPGWGLPISCDRLESETG